MYNDDQNFWNFIFSIFFALFFALLMWILYMIHGTFALFISPFELTIIALATFRLIRLFVYDKVARFVRDLFVEKREVILDDGLVSIERVHPATGPRRTMSELLECPWCFGIWAALIVTFFYFATPIAWPVILVLAVAGLGSLIQLIANAIGWTAEKKKIETGLLKEEL